jgi:hypothetical protein
MTKGSFKLPSQANLELAKQLKAKLKQFINGSFQLLFRPQQNRPSVILYPRI